MEQSSSTKVRPLSSLCLRIRENLVFSPQYTNGRIAYYIVEDTLTTRFFRLGVAEHGLARQLNGYTTIQDALANLSVTLSKHRLSEVDAIAFCYWLVEMDLALSQDARTSDRVEQRAASIERTKRQSRWNPLGLRIPLLKPDRFLEWTLAYVGWLFSRKSVGLWGMLVFAGVVSIAQNWQRFVEMSTAIFEVENGWWLFGCWVGLKVIHESAHGLVCKRFGGSVCEAGIQCLWFVPMPYVDVTSCWRFPSRWPRIMVAAAGIYAEFGIAAIAAILWANTETGLLNYVAYNVVFMASLTTLLFNANPLMKLDGYYIFSDLVGIPNLYQHGQHRVQNWFNRIVLGLPTTESATTSSKSFLVFVYGWLSLMWRIGLSVTLTIAMARYTGQAGFWVAAILACLWLGPGLRQFGKSLTKARSGLRPRRFRIVALIAMVVTVVTGLLNNVPWPMRIEAPAIVEYSVPVSIRATGSGRVVDVNVASGQTVRAGDLLLVQENRELVGRVATLRLQIEQIEIRERRFQQKSQLASRQAESEQRHALEVELTAKESELSELEIRASHSGIIDHPDLLSLEGRFLKAGDEVLRITTESNKELRVAIAQQDFDYFSHQIGARLRVRIAGLPVVEGRLEKIVPRASLTLIDPAFASVYGGSLPVRSTRDREEKRSTSNEGYELLTPCLEGVVSIDAIESCRLRAGQRAFVSSRDYCESIGEHLYRLIDHTIRFESSQKEFVYDSGIAR